MRFSLYALPLSAALCAAASACATPIVTAANAPLSGSPTTFTLGGAGNAFASTSADTGNGSGAAVATGGSGLVTSFLGGVSDFGAGSTVGFGGIYSFSSFPTASVIPFSAADDFIGLAFTLADGIHFGYAEVNGSNLISYAYESTPGASITTVPAAALPSAITPEPSSLALLGTGLVGIVSVLKRRLT